MYWQVSPHSVILFHNYEGERNVLKKTVGDCLGVGFLAFFGGGVCFFFWGLRGSRWLKSGTGVVPVTSECLSFKKWGFPQFCHCCAPWQDGSAEAGWFCEAHHCGELASADIDQALGHIRNSFLSSAQLAGGERCKSPMCSVRALKSTHCPTCHQRYVVATLCRRDEMKTAALLFLMMSQQFRCVLTVMWSLHRSWQDLFFLIGKTRNFTQMAESVPVLDYYVGLNHLTLLQLYHIKEEDNIKLYKQDTC